MDVNEYLEAKRDGDDFIRTEAIREMRKYSRRIKSEAESNFKELRGNYPSVNPMLLARVAMHQTEPRLFGDIAALTEFQEATSGLPALTS